MLTTSLVATYIVFLTSSYFQLFYIISNLNKFTICYSFFFFFLIIFYESPYVVLLTKTFTHTSTLKKERGLFSVEECGGYIIKHSRFLNKVSCRLFFLILLSHLTYDFTFFKIITILQKTY